MIIDDITAVKISYLHTCQNLVIGQTNNICEIFVNGLLLDGANTQDMVE